MFLDLYLMRNPILLTNPEKVIIWKWIIFLKILIQGPNFDGCGCAASEYGCCPDGNSTALGNNFEVRLYNCKLKMVVNCPDCNIISLCRMNCQFWYFVRIEIILKMPSI